MKIEDITEPIYQDILDTVDETIEKIKSEGKDTDDGWSGIFDKLLKIKIFYGTE